MAPPGFQFERESGDILMQVFGGPTTDPVPGPAYVRDEVGALSSSAPNSPIMLILELNDTFTADQLNAYITFEGNAAGGEIESPAGYPMWFKAAVGETTCDATMVFLGKFDIALRSEPGVDSVAILDAFIAETFE